MEDDRIRVRPCGCRYDAPTGTLTCPCQKHSETRTARRRPASAKKPLRTFRVTFSAVAACVTIRAASAREARTIAEDHQLRGELTAENMAGEVRLLPEGREISAEFYSQGETEPLVSRVEEVP